MCAAGDLRAHQRIFPAKTGGIHLFERISSHVAVTVARAAVKALRADAVLLHCPDDFHLVIFCPVVDFFKPLF